MDPNSGKLYPSVDAATAAGVLNPVELRGQLEDLLRISEAVKAAKSAERDAALKVQA